MNGFVAARIALVALAGRHRLGQSPWTVAR